jgi:hypothetical protein
LPISLSRAQPPIEAKVVRREPPKMTIEPSARVETLLRLARTVHQLSSPSHKSRWRKNDRPPGEGIASHTNFPPTIRVRPRVEHTPPPFRPNTFPRPAAPRSPPARIVLSPWSSVLGPWSLVLGPSRRQKEIAPAGFPKNQGPLTMDQGLMTMD